MRLAAKSWKYLGIAYYQTWVFIVVMSLAMVPEGQQVVDETWLRVALSGTLALALIAVMFFEHHLDVLHNGRWVLSMAGCLAGVGTLVMSQAIALYGSMALCAFGIVCISVGNATILLAWIEYLVRVPQSEQLRYTLTAWPVAALAVPVVSLLPQGALGAVACILPVASALTIIACSQYRCAGEREAWSGLEAGTTWKRPQTRLLCACLVVSFAFGCARTLPAVTAVMANSSWAYFLVALAFVTVLVLSRTGVVGPDLAVKVYRLCFPVLILSYLALPFLPSAATAFDVASLMAASYLFEMLVWLVCPLVVVERGFGNLQLFGWGAVAFHVGSFIGLLFGDWAEDLFGFDGFSTMLPMCIAGALVVVMGYVFREQGVSDLFKPARMDAAVEVPQDALLSLCRELAEEFGLTAREEQVLVLLARGRSVPYIEQELSISTSTAKTHVRHIYDKLGVHNKQELLDLFA